jgi:hypothetical protein
VVSVPRGFARLRKPQSYRSRSPFIERENASELRIVPWEFLLFAVLTKERTAVQAAHLFYVPAADVHCRLSGSEFTCAVGGAYFALLPGKQRDVVVFPDYWQDLFVLGAFVDF